jgi:hypothetical protein
MIGAFWMIVLVCGALPGTVLAADDQDRDDATLIGAWRQSIIFPGVPVEFFDVIAFHEDGTVTEQFGNRSDGSAGIGVWKKVGRGTFAVTFENFGDRNHDGTFDVRFRIRLTYHVIDRNTLTATGTSDTFSVDGTTEIAPSFPGVTIQATRMHVVRE